MSLRCGRKHLPALLLKPSRGFVGWRLCSSITVASNTWTRSPDRRPGEMADSDSAASRRSQRFEDFHPGVLPPDGRGSNSKATRPSGPSSFNRASKALPARLLNPLSTPVVFPASNTLAWAVVSFLPATVFHFLSRVDRTLCASTNTGFNPLVTVPVICVVFTNPPKLSTKSNVSDVQSDRSLPQ